jgi:hypothetical protein
MEIFTFYLPALAVNSQVGFGRTLSYFLVQKFGFTKTIT